jgi:hypothetical protein
MPSLSMWYSQIPRGRRAATASNGIRALTEALVLHRSGHQQASRLLGTIVGTYTALGSEAPALG